MKRGRGCRHVIRLALSASFTAVRRMVIVIAIRATGTLGFFAFGKLLMSLREKKETIGRWAGGVGRGSKPCIIVLR